MQGGKLYLGKLLRFSRKGSPLVEHRVDSALEGTHTPAFYPGHLSVELSLQWLLERQQLTEVPPAQLSPQCGDNLRLREGLGELHHAPEILLRESAAVLADEMTGDLQPAAGSSLAHERIFPAHCGCLAVPNLITTPPVSFQPSADQQPARMACFQPTAESSENRPPFERSPGPYPLCQIRSSPIHSVSAAGWKISRSWLQKSP